MYSLKIMIGIICILSLSATSQEIKIDDVHTIEFKNIEVNQIDNSLIIKALIQSNKKDSLDINAFSLIDEVNKIRYRICGFNAARGVSNVGFGHMDESFLKTNLLDSKGKRYPNLPKYNPNYKDSFSSFIFEGIENCESRVNFGSNRSHSWNDLFKEKKDLISVVYFPSVKSKWKKYVCWFRFSLNDCELDPELKFYHGKKNLALIK